MLTACEHLEELAILARQRIEGAHGLARGGALALSDPVQLSNRRRRVVDLRQRVEVAAVGGQRDIAIPKEIRHTLAHRYPLGDLASLTKDLLTNLECRGSASRRISASTLPARRATSTRRPCIASRTTSSSSRASRSLTACTPSAARRRIMPAPT